VLFIKEVSLEWGKFIETKKDEKNQSQKIRKSSKKLFKKKGMVTIPFLLVSMILIFLILSFLFLNMTLVHVSITQYMSYSTARKLFLANVSPDDQQTSAQDHYARLRESFFDSNAYTGNPGDWFYIPVALDSKSLGKQYGQYPQTTDPEKERFFGVIIPFTTYILKLKIPFLSQGSDKKSLGGGINAFLGREPAKSECINFIAQKYEALKNRCSGRYDCPNIKKPKGIEGYKGDNGC